MSPIRHSTRPDPGAASLGALLAAALLALAVGGCGLFNPANPEPPGSGAGNVRLPALTDPESTLSSLEVGIETKQLQVYEHALAETSSVTPADFHATFDPQDIANFELSGTQAPTDWTSQDEKTFFTYFVRRPATYVAYFLPDTSRADDKGIPVTTLYRRYRIYAGASLEAAGLADLTFKRIGVNGEWKLTFWVDRQDTTALSTYGRQRLDSLIY